jgi:hypothetical protein
MSSRYEYKFVRLGEKKSLFWGYLPLRPSSVESYQDVIRQHAKEGWRLVQIFAPGIAMQGQAAFYELIFERAIDDHHAPSTAERAESAAEWRLTKSKPGSVG